MVLSDQLGERRLVTCTEALDETRVAALHRATVTERSYMRQSAHEHRPL
jgi:hypothetical protein